MPMRVVAEKSAVKRKGHRTKPKRTAVVPVITPRTTIAVAMANAGTHPVLLLLYILLLPYLTISQSLPVTPTFVRLKNLYFSTIIPGFHRDIIQFGSFLR